MQIILVFFLWSTVFSNPAREIFGYNREKILTYIFGILILKAIVLSARAVDVAGEISRGDLTNYLLKPISYFKYWFVRDISSKVLNLLFASVETVVLLLILRPPLYFQTNPGSLLAFLISILIAIILFFGLLFLVNLVALWMPENGWAAQFLFMVIIVEFLSGGVFPLDILPRAIQGVLYSLPFPYLLFFPLQVYLGKLSAVEVVKGLVISGIWVGLILFSVRAVWQKGIRNYSAEGR